MLFVNPEDVINHARSEHHLEVHKVEDFRNMNNQYHLIEQVVEDYQESYITESSLSGLTAGIGGVATSAALSGMDLISFSIRLYRLAQQCAILNGFEGEDPAEKEQMLDIYFEALGLNAVAQATLKPHFLKASAVAGTKQASQSLLLKLIVQTAKLLGKNISSRSAGRLIPVVGGLIGASLNHSFARKTSSSLKQAYKNEYFKRWYGGVTVIEAK
ncbi:EcsC family protein [Gracilimonas mengyeensis]|uniref:EcsC protein family protein n=1 Tax=Gracilimonas mengyeensis TaxID=1302730 RepID=A0A521DPH0_9BACT|nr:EcsC family protein [Gracilimonas mengyeensis]SMO73593.1 EcsC protein family protein [Gracilimonas mengyeensis]